jgi:hypothetical protein
MIASFGEDIYNEMYIVDSLRGYIQNSKGEIVEKSWD